MFCLRTPTIALLVHLLLLTGGALPVFGATPDGKDNPTAANEGFMPDSVLNNAANANVVVKDLRQDVVSADHQPNKDYEQLSPFVAHTNNHGNGTAVNDRSTAEVLAEEVDGRLSTDQTRKTPAAAVRVKRDDEPKPTEKDENGKNKGGDCDANPVLMKFLGGFVGFGFSLGTGMLIASICMICCRPKGGAGVEQQMSESQISIQQPPAASGSQESQPVPSPQNN